MEDKQGQAVTANENGESVATMTRGESVRFTEGRERSLANLRPAWRKGESGNPAGRKTAGAVVKEYANSWAGKLTRAELQAIIDDEASPIAQVAAARRLLAQDLEAEAESREATKLILDYTDGKPRQQLDVTSVNATVSVTADMTPRAANLLSDLAGELTSDDDAPSPM